MTAERSANTQRYNAKQAKGLSAVQWGLLAAALADERAHKYGFGLYLDREHVPAALGLERRGLVVTDRPMASPLWARSKRAVPGTRRSYSLTNDGRAVAKQRKDAVLPPRVPLELGEAKQLLRELADAVLRDDGLAVNLARAARERLAEAADA